MNISPDNLKVMGFEEFGECWLLSDCDVIVGGSGVEWTAYTSNYEDSIRVTTIAEVVQFVVKVCTEHGQQEGREMAKQQLQELLGIHQE